jgi:type IV pilus assembly protein PilY1
MQQTNDPFAYPPTWPNPTQNRSPTAVDDLWHATINGRGQNYTTSDVTGTVAKIQAMVADLLNKSGSAAAVAVSNVNVRAGDNTAYASVYSTGGWYGDLLAFSVDVTTGNVTTSTPLWSVRDRLEPRFSTRVIATYNSATRTAMPFRWASLSAAMQSQLSNIPSAPSLTNGSETLDFLRGDRAPEADGYRIRAYLMGDVVDAEPVSVRGGVGSYNDPGYSLFHNLQDTRRPMVYQAANDGMLHAIDAATGDETWAYVPNLVFPSLSELASPTMCIISMSMARRWRAMSTSGTRAVPRRARRIGKRSWSAVCATAARATTRSMSPIPTSSTRMAQPARCCGNFPTAPRRRAWSTISDTASASRSF